MREQLFPLLHKACRLTSEGLRYFTIYTNAIAAGTKLVENLGDDLATGNGARKWGSVNSSQRENEETFTKQGKERGRNKKRNGNYKIPSILYPEDGGRTLEGTQRLRNLV